MLSDERREKRDGRPWQFFVFVRSFAAMRMFLLLPMALFLLAGCVSQESLLRSKNHTRIPIDHASAKDITAAAEKAFARHGFQPAPDTTPQEIVLAKSSPPPLRFIKGGNAIVWLVLEPRPQGWDIYCVPEPDNLYPGGTALRFDPVLREVQAQFAPR